MRERLEDFAAGRLGPQAKGEVQGHLLHCEECADVFGKLLMEQVASGALPELAPPSLPPQSLYDRYLRARRPASSWRIVLDALRDAASRESVAARLEEIRAGFELFANPLYATGMSTRGSPQSDTPRNQIEAEVLLPTGEPSGTTVTFRVSALPRITGESHFVMTLATAAREYDGHVVVCTVTLPKGEAVSFDAPIERTGQHEERTVGFDAPELPISNCRIPLDRVSLAIV
jgi:hypothetical protein